MAVLAIQQYKYTFSFNKNGLFSIQVVVEVYGNKGNVFLGNKSFSNGKFSMADAILYSH